MITLHYINSNLLVLRLSGVMVAAVLSQGVAFRAECIKGMTKYWEPFISLLSAKWKAAVVMGRNMSSNLINNVKLIRLKCIRLVNLLLIKEKLPIYAAVVELADTRDFRPNRH